MAQSQKFRLNPWQFPTPYIMTGDQIVADGEVLTSDGLEVNESHLTGESIPVFKKPGDFLYSGSFIVAGSGTAKVLKSVEDSYAAKLTKKGTDETSGNV